MRCPAEQYLVLHRQSPGCAPGRRAGPSRRRSCQPGCMPPEAPAIRVKSRAQALERIRGSTPAKTCITVSSFRRYRLSRCLADAPIVLELGSGRGSSLGQAQQGRIVCSSASRSTGNRCGTRSTAPTQQFANVRFTGRISGTCRSGAGPVVEEVWVLFRRPSVQAPQATCPEKILAHLARVRCRMRAVTLCDRPRSTSRRRSR